MNFTAAPAAAAAGRYFHKGSLLYVGGDKAGADLPLLLLLLLLPGTSIKAACWMWVVTRQALTCR
jgi:hypothetical protein